MSRFPAVPADFATVAPTKGVKELRLHYHAGWKTVVKWCAMAGVEPKPVVVMLRYVAPSDFAYEAMTLIQLKLMAYYKVSATIIIRWVSEMPDEWKLTRRINLARTTVRRAPKVIKPRGPSMHAKFDSERVRTIEDLAAMHLQRRFVPVVRATIYGRQYAGLWQVGRLKMAEADMVALARKQGWAA